MINDFLAADCKRVFMPAITADQGNVLPPKLSEVCGLLVIPLGAAGPTDWTSKSAIEATADNTVTTNTNAKWITGRGEVPQPEDVVVELGKTERRIARRLYSLEFEVNVRCDPELNFLKAFQRNYRAFRFWFATRGGRFLGGTQGVYPRFVTAWSPLLRDDVERGFIRIEWFADGAPTRATVGNLFDGAAGDPGTPTPIENVMYYQQSFASASTSALTWTANSGVLPNSNTSAQILVFQNGQKLEESAGQYSVSHLTGPGESTITVGASTHFSGANYEVIAVVTS